MLEKYIKQVTKIRTLVPLVALSFILTYLSLGLIAESGFTGGDQILPVLLLFILVFFLLSIIAVIIDNQLTQSKKLNSEEKRDKVASVEGSKKIKITQESNAVKAEVKDSEETEITQSNLPPSINPSGTKKKN